MKEYYLDRLRWIFGFKSRNFFYCIAKLLCLIVGVPLYFVLFIAEMALTFVNLLFCWIPLLGMAVGIICKFLMVICDVGFYVCILPDIKDYNLAHAQDKQDLDDTCDEEDVLCKDDYSVEDAPADKTDGGDSQ
ncbi:MAG: hypothetical protein NC350_00820 [Corallococcus sp.]|nr:hypothetical protein [Corallococcus sp.]